MAETPAVIYAAKSTEDTKDSTGTQVERCREAIDREGGRKLVAEPFIDTNVSGYQRSRGKGLDDAIAAAKEAAAQQGGAELWVFHSSRFGRGSGRPGEARSLLEIFTDTRRAGVTLRSVEDDAFVSEGTLMGIADQQAYKYSADLAGHVKAGKQRQFERGERLGGPVPDGYDLEVTTDTRGNITERRYFLDAAREPTIRRLFELALEGHGAPSIARVLNREGHQTKSGRPWRRRRVQETLKSPFYAGLAARRGEKIGPTEYRRFKDPELRPGSWPGYVAADEWKRIQQGMVDRDRASKHRPQGRRSTRYALAKLAVCGRCGERMYAVTSGYKRKDGTQRRTYHCGNAKDSTGLCNQAPVDAGVIDAAVVKHLNRLFVDFEAWLEQVALGTQTQRDAQERDVAATLAELDKVNRREVKLRGKALDVLDGTTPEDRAALELYQHVIAERDRLQEALRGLQERLAAEPDEPPTDTMLDVYNGLAKAVRAGDGDGVAELNDRLRAVFQEVRLEEVEPGVVGVAPILQADVVERYSGVLPVTIGPDKIAQADLPPDVPVVLWATDGPPSPAIVVGPDENEPHSQA